MNEIPPARRSSDSHVFVEQRHPSRRQEDHFRFKGFGVNFGGSGNGIFIGLIVVIVCFIIVLAWRTYQHEQHTSTSLTEIKVMLMNALKQPKGN
jgi:hypothetical protein